MKTLSPTLQNIRHYLLSIFRNNNASREEMHNFLFECVKYVLEENDLNIKDFNITIHKNVKHFEVDCDGFMRADDNDFTKYDFFFKNDFFKIKSRDDVESLTYPLYVFFHEVGHMMQYILAAEEIEIFDEEKLATEKTLTDLIYTPHKTQEQRILKKALIKYSNAQDIVCQPEKDANRQSYLYLKDLINTLLASENDIEFAKYLSMILADLQYIRKEEFMFYRKYGKSNREAIKVLKDNKLDFELYLCD